MIPGDGSMIEQLVFHVAVTDHGGLPSVVFMR